MTLVSLREPQLRLRKTRAVPLLTNIYATKICKTFCRDHVAFCIYLLHCSASLMLMGNFLKWQLGVRLAYIQVGGKADDAAYAAPSPSRFALGRRSQAHTETDKRNTTKFVVCNSENDIKTRKLLVNTFIRDIIWYGDHIVITYNFQEYATTDRFCKSYVEQLEKQVGEASRSASSFSLGSYKFRHSAPKSREVSRDFLFRRRDFLPVADAIGTLCNDRYSVTPLLTSPVPRTIVAAR